MNLVESTQYVHFVKRNHQMKKCFRDVYCSLNRPSLVSRSSKSKRKRCDEERGAATFFSKLLKSCNVRRHEFSFPQIYYKAVPSFKESSRPRHVLCSRLRHKRKPVQNSAETLISFPIVFNSHILIK